MVGYTPLTSLRPGAGAFRNLTVQALTRQMFDPKNMVAAMLSHVVSRPLHLD